MPMTRPPGPWNDPPRPASPTVEIRSGNAHAAIAARGAEPVAWSVGGTDLLWDADPTWWPKSAPVLFPLCAQTRFGAIKVDGVSYPIPIHGVSPTSNYTVEDQAADRVRMVLRDSPETRASYPFAFVLTVEYRLAANRFTAAFEVRNPGDVTMPYAVGFHPGFNWPFSGGDKHGHALVFDEPENPAVPLFTSTGLVRRETRTLPMQGARLPLGPDLFTGGPLCFFNARSKSVRFENGAGGAIVVTVEDLPHFAIWTKPGAPYLCIETWTGHSDPEDFDGELADKPSMRFLAPGATARHAVTLSYEAG
jgi:galactose mutarotase-like enzyme